MMKKRQVVLRRGEDQSRTTTVAAASSFTVTYGECQKNHAASIGGYALDGCREFMARGDQGTPAALICAACGCHRNFHRREVEADPSFPSRDV